MTSQSKEYQHPRVIRITHWVNFIALGIMITSGLRIYNASPLWGFEIPPILTLGGWLAGARMWHFFGMWLFFVNGLVWVLFNVASRHGRRTTIFRTSDIVGLLPMIRYYLGLRRDHPVSGKYNALQKLAYSSTAALAAGAILSGMGIYWPVQFRWITWMFGGYDTARVWHFLFMASIVFFFLGHLVMVGIAGRANLVSIFTGWKRLDKEPAAPRTTTEKRKPPARIPVDGEQTGGTSL